MRVKQTSDSYEMSLIDTRFQFISHIEMKHIEKIVKFFCLYFQAFVSLLVANLARNRAHTIFEPQFCHKSTNSNKCWTDSKNFIKNLWPNINKRVSFTRSRKQHGRELVRSACQASLTNLFFCSLTHNSIIPNIFDFTTQKI